MVASIQSWHITFDDKLVFEQGTSFDDRARGYYDPDNQEVVITLIAKDMTTLAVDRYVRRDVLRLVGEA